MISKNNSFDLSALTVWDGIYRNIVEKLGKKTQEKLKDLIKFSVDPKPEDKSLGAILIPAVDWLKERLRHEVCEPVGLAVIHFQYHNEATDSEQAHVHMNYSGTKKLDPALENIFSENKDKMFLFTGLALGDLGYVPTQNSVDLKKDFKGMQIPPFLLCSNTNIHEWIDTQDGPSKLLGLDEFLLIRWIKEEYACSQINENSDERWSLRVESKSPQTENFFQYIDKCVKDALVQKKLIKCEKGTIHPKNVCLTVQCYQHLYVGETIPPEESQCPPWLSLFLPGFTVPGWPFCENGLANSL